MTAPGSGGLVEKVAQAIFRADCPNATEEDFADMIWRNDAEYYERNIYLRLAAAAVQVVQDQLAERLVQHQGIFHDFNYDDDWADGYQPRFSPSCTCGWSDMSYLVPEIYPTIAGARRAHANHVVGVAALRRPPGTVRLGVGDE